MDRTAPVFSIIIPTYNRVAFLPRAVRSVQRQLFSDWELLIVDDGSTDNTGEVAQAAAERDARIRYIFQSNKKLNGARNTGIKASTGRYLCFLDDDDEFLPHHLSYLSEAVRAHPAPGVVIRTGLLYAYKGRLRKAPLYNDPALHPVAQLWRKPVNLLSFAFPRQVFETCAIDESIHLINDFHILNQVLLNYSFIQLKEYTAIYHIHDQMQTRTYTNDFFLEHCISVIQNLYMEYALAPVVPKQLYQNLLCHKYFHFSRNFFRYGEARKGIKAAVQGLKWFNPSMSRSLLGVMLETVRFGKRKWLG